MSVIRARAERGTARRLRRRLPVVRARAERGTARRLRWRLPVVRARAERGLVAETALPAACARAEQALFFFDVTWVASGGGRGARAAPLHSGARWAWTQEAARQKP